MERQYSDAQEQQAQAIKELADAKDHGTPGAEVAADIAGAGAQGDASPATVVQDSPEKLEIDRKRRTVDATKAVAEQLGDIKKKLKEQFNKKRKVAAEDADEDEEDGNDAFDIDVEFDNIAEAAATALTTAGLKGV